MSVKFETNLCSKNINGIIFGDMNEPEAMRNPDMVRHVITEFYCIEMYKSAVLVGYGLGFQH
jgi:hypothetical protein